MFRNALLWWLCFVPALAWAESPLPAASPTSSPTALPASRPAPPVPPARPTLATPPLLRLSASGRPILRWGADPSGGAPYIFADPNDANRYIGYEKEMVEALAKEIGYEPVFVKGAWDTLVPSLNRGDFDIVVNGLEPTTDRAKIILFSKPYYLFRLQMTVHADTTTLKSLEDCKKQKCRMGTLLNTAASRLLESLQIPYKPYDDPVTAYKDLEIKRIDAALIDVPMAIYYAQDKPKLKAACPPFHTGAYIIGLRTKDAALKVKIDEGIDKIIQKGTLEEILKRWKLWDELQPTLAKGKATYQVTERKFTWKMAFTKLFQAALVTIALAFGSMFIAVFLGLPIALGQMQGPTWLRILCTVYVEFFRGTPVLVQLLFLYFGLPVIGIALPAWLTALVGLGLNYAAYESQVYRTALGAIPQGQWEVAIALGMSKGVTFQRIILPQAFRIALPPMTNDFVALFKDTSVAFAISVWELATAYRELASASQEFLLMGLITSCFYLSMSIPLSWYARRLEEKLQNRSGHLVNSK